MRHAADAGLRVPCSARPRRDAIAHLKEALLVIERLIAGVFKVKALMRKVPKVLVLRIVGLVCYLQGHIVRLGVLYLLFPGLDLPLPPRGDDRHLGGEVLYCKLETHLIVAFAGGAVSDGGCAGGVGDIDLMLGDERAGERTISYEELLKDLRAHGKI